MLSIRLTFPAGRYHATPWGRHVNEADVSWPPEPWRIVRTLIATWHRKLDPVRYPKEGLEALLSVLASVEPVYRLPPAVHSHVRHYMPGPKFGPDPGDKTLIFDAFARLAADKPLFVAWPNTQLDNEQTALLDALLTAIGYLGRAESWVEAERFTGWDIMRADCTPGDMAIDRDSGEVSGELVSLFVPLSPGEYASFRHETLAGMEKRAMKPTERKLVTATLPQSWIDAISLDTAELQRAGWSQPPAARRVSYRRPMAALKARTSMLHLPRRLSATATTARFALYGKPLPLIEHTVRVGEWSRAAAMSQARQILGDAGVPHLISGHGLPEGNRHDHAFYLPEDADGDGRIDHLLIHVPGGLDELCLRVLGAITRLWNRDGGEWRMVFEGQGPAIRFEQDCPLVRESLTWRSLTPYLHPWHWKRSLGVPEQIRRECRERGWPEPDSIEPLDSVEIAPGLTRRAVQFHRFRSKRGLIQPDTRGSLVALTFDVPVRGPIALGFGCHFGLGLFVPA